MGLLLVALSLLVVGGVTLASVPPDTLRYDSGTGTSAQTLDYMNSTQGYWVGVNNVISAARTGTFVTVDTGQGANELYPMDQAVRTTDDAQFNTIDVQGISLNTVNKTDIFLGDFGALDITTTGNLDIQHFYGNQYSIKDPAYQLFQDGFLNFRGTWNTTGNIIPLNATTVEMPQIVSDGTDFYIYYEYQIIGKWNIGVAISRNGILGPYNEVHQPIVSPSGTIGSPDKTHTADPTVLYLPWVNPPWHMWIDMAEDATWRGVGKLTSTDGITWIKYDKDADGNIDNLIPQGDYGEWDSNMIHCPEAYLWNGKVRLIYSGQGSGHTSYDSGLALAHDISGLGYNFTKYGQITDDETIPTEGIRIRSPIIINSVMYAALGRTDPNYLGASTDGGITWDIVCEIPEGIHSFLIEDGVLYATYNSHHDLYYRDLRNLYQSIPNNNSLNSTLAGGIPVTYNVKTLDVTKEYNYRGDKLWAEDIIYDDFNTNTASLYEIVSGIWTYNLTTGWIESQDIGAVPTTQRIYFDSSYFELYSTAMRSGIVTARIQIPSSATNKLKAGLTLRDIQTTNYMWLLINPSIDQLELGQYNGTTNTLDTATITIDYDVWYTLTLFWSNNGDLKGYLDDPGRTTPLVEANDDTVISAEIGFRTYQCLAYFDLLEIHPLHIRHVSSLP